MKKLTIIVLTPRSHEERKKTRILRSRQQSSEALAERETSGCVSTTTGMEDEGHDSNNTDDDDADDDALCPICLCEMVREGGGEQLTCCSSWHNSLHFDCMAIWTEECHSSQGDSLVFCPLCRSVWSPVAAVAGVEAAAAAERGAMAALRPSSNNNNSSAYQYFAPSPYTAPGVGAAVGSVAATKATGVAATAAAVRPLAASGSSSSYSRWGSFFNH